MDLLKLLTEKSLLWGVARRKDGLAGLVSSVADTHFDGIHVVTGHTRTCLAFFPDDFRHSKFKPERAILACDADGVAAHCVRHSGMVYDPPEAPSKNVHPGWEVREASIGDDTVVFVLPAWILDKP